MLRAGRPHYSCLALISLMGSRCPVFIDEGLIDQRPFRSPALIHHTPTARQCHGNEDCQSFCTHKSPWKKVLYWAGIKKKTSFLFSFVSIHWSCNVSLGTICSLYGFYEWWLSVRWGVAVVIWKSQRPPACQTAVNWPTQGHKWSIKWAARYQLCSHTGTPA